MNNQPPLTIAMVAGEASGDNLGAPLIREILRRNPQATFVGIGGPRMIAEGMVSDFDLERLSVNGFIDPLMRLPELIKMLFAIRDRVIAARVDCFVGIDFNFFNLLLAGLLHRKGIRTVHYVSPTVWAWRARRVRNIAKNVDLMLTLYPFETEIYQQHGIDVAFVGHPKADEISSEDGRMNRTAAREEFGFTVEQKIAAILPGSRSSEVRLSGADFLKTALLLSDDIDVFVIPAANTRRRVQIEAMLAQYPVGFQQQCRIVDGQATKVLTAADVALVNSGTATLEAMLLRRPMIMSYRLGRITYAIISRMVTTRFFALPNILAGRELVPEFIQYDAIPEVMAKTVLQLLADDAQQARVALMQEFDRIHTELRPGGTPGGAAALAVLKICDNNAGRVNVP